MTGLIGWWPLHENSGRASDLSGNGNHGTLNGGVTQGVAGKGGLTSYSFDGVDDVVVAPQSGELSPASITVTAWVKWDGTTPDTYRPRVCQWGSKHQSLRVYTDGTVEAAFLIDGTYYEVSTADVIKGDEWTHIAATYDGSNLSIYMNGGLEGSLNQSGSINSGTQDLYIGDDGTGANSYPGKISDLRLYNRALSPQEIQALYEWGNGDYASPPNDRTDSSAVSRWKFDGDATDSWGSNDGTVQGDIGFTGGIKNQAAKFSGDDYVDTGITDLGSSFSLSAWTNLENNSPSKNRIFGKWNDIDGYDIILDANNDSYRIVIDTDSGADVLKGGSTTSRGWKHVLCSWDGTTARLYVNGVLKGSLTPNSYNSSNDRLAISAFKSDRRFKGRIDDARFYSRHLSPSEAFQLYQWGTGGRDMRKLTVKSR